MARGVATDQNAGRSSNGTCAGRSFGTVSPRQRQTSGLTQPTDEE